MNQPLFGGRARWLAAPALASAMVGCGESRPGVGVSTFPVQGKVVLADGKPLTSGVVVFVPGDGAAPQASGTINPDGSFRVMTQGIVAGAPAGDYKVRLEADPDAPAAGASPKRRGGPPFPARYGKESTSGLTATVKAEPENELPPFVLK